MREVEGEDKWSRLSGDFVEARGLEGLVNISLGIKELRLQTVATNPFLGLPL